MGDPAGPMKTVPATTMAENTERETPNDPRYSTRTNLDPLPHNTEFVFLRRNLVKVPLSIVYEGPYRVLQQNAKTLWILKPSSEDTVSADRCKTAFLELPDEPQHRWRTTEQEKRGRRSPQQ